MKFPLGVELVPQPVAVVYASSHPVFSVSESSATKRTRLKSYNVVQRILTVLYCALGARRVDLDCSRKWRLRATATQPSAKEAFYWLGIGNELAWSGRMCRCISAVSVPLIERRSKRKSHFIHNSRMKLAQTRASEFGMGSWSWYQGRLDRLVGARVRRRLSSTYCIHPPPHSCGSS